MTWNRKKCRLNFFCFFYIAKRIKLQKWFKIVKCVWNWLIMNIFMKNILQTFNYEKNCHFHWLLILFRHHVNNHENKQRFVWQIDVLFVVNFYCNDDKWNRFFLLIENFVEMKNCFNNVDAKDITTFDCFLSMSLMYFNSNAVWNFFTRVFIFFCN